MSYVFRENLRNRYEIYIRNVGWSVIKLCQFEPGRSR